MWWKLERELVLKTYKLNAKIATTLLYNPITLYYNGLI